MILLSSLVEFNQIRSVLTVSEADLPEDTLTHYGLEDDLGYFLDKHLIGWEDYDAVDSLHRKLKVLVKYKAAALVATTAPVFVLKKMTDGSNEGQRSDRDGFLWLAEKLNKKVTDVLNDILIELGQESWTLAPSLVGRSIPTRDPITEPRE